VRDRERFPEWLNMKACCDAVAECMAQGRPYTLNCYICGAAKEPEIRMCDMEWVNVTDVRICVPCARALSGEGFNDEAISRAVDAVLGCDA